MKKIIFLHLIGAISLLLVSCKEEEPFLAGSKDKTPPGKISDVTYKPLYGGARFFYSIPRDRDLLRIEGVYTNPKQKSFTFTASYFSDSLDVYGLPDANEYTIRLYAVDRSGNKSEASEVKVVPLQPAYMRVAESIEVKSGFSSFFLDWTNELKQSVNVYVEFKYTLEGSERTSTTVFSSNLPQERRFINNLALGPGQDVDVKVRVEDMYGNVTETIDKGKIALYEDIEIPKIKWILPNPNDSIGGVPMCFGDGLEGRNRYVIDGIIDRGDNLNFMHTNSRGRTGKNSDGNMPWNFMIDLGDYYELSRIVTVQRHSGGLANISRGQYYQAENVGIYNMYYWDEDTKAWVKISQHQIPVPLDKSELEMVKLGEAGDMAYMYPDDPKYTKRTRWFRYEALKGFSGNYTLDDANCLSEITLYGRKSQ